MMLQSSKPMIFLGFWGDTRCEIESPIAPLTYWAAWVLQSRSGVPDAFRAMASVRPKRAVPHRICPSVAHSTHPVPKGAVFLNRWSTAGKVSWACGE